MPNVRLVQHVKLRPNTPYRFSCWAKTRDLGPVGAFHLLALGASQPGRQLTFHEGGLESNQDWKRIEVVFNSLDQKEANLYVGIWGEGPGTLWVNDLSLEELPLVNVLRRKGCPLTIKSADGRTTYEEGRDFEPVIDPQLGNVPWPGEYEFDHAGAKVRIKPGSRIKSGDRLLVSWYHPVITLSWAGHVLPQRAETGSDPSRPGSAGQRAVPPAARSSCRTMRSAWRTGARLAAIAS